MGSTERVPPEIREIERDRLDNCWRQLPAFSVSDATLAAELLAATTRGIVNHHFGLGDPFQAHDQQRRYMGALRWCMRWLLDPARARTTESLEPVEFDRAVALGADYEDVADFFKTCGAGLASAKLIDSGSTVEFHYDEAASETIFRPYYLSAAMSRSPAILPNFEELFKLAQLLINEGPATALSSRSARQVARTLVSPTDEIVPEDWSLGEYTVGQAQRAWRPLMALSLASALASQQDIGGHEILRFSQSDFVALVRRAFNNDVGAKQWVSDLAWIPTDSRSDASIMPFIVVGSSICMSSGLLTIFNHQRNLLKCVVKRRPSVWDALKNAKEKVFRTELKALLGPRGWSVLPGTEVREGGRTIGDIDAVMIGPDGDLIFTELKWPLGADEIVEVQQDQKEIRKGVQQVTDMAAWARSNWAAFRQKMPQVRHTSAPDFLGRLVLSRTTFPTGDLGDAAGCVLAGYDWLVRLAAEPLPRSGTGFLNALATPPMPDLGNPTYHVLKLGGVTWRLPSLEVSERLLPLSP